MTLDELKEQIQIDLMCLLENFGVEEVMEKEDYQKLKDLICDSIITNVNKSIFITKTETK